MRHDPPSLTRTHRQGLETSLFALTSALADGLRPMTWNIEGGTQPPRVIAERVEQANGLSVYAVHWKSSRGEDCTADDRENARRREVQAAGLVADAAGVLEDGRSLVVAGDFNSQAPGRVLRVGTDPGEDCAPTDGTCAGLCGAGGLDGYDDSIAILLLGLDDSARLLSGALEATYVLRHFPGGAIDHILVAGPAAAGFSEATTPPVSGKRWQGSDHRPVVAVGAGIVDRPR